MNPLDLVGPAGRADQGERPYDAHADYTSAVNAEPQTLFEWLDDPRHLGSHMQQRSWRTLGTRMGYRFDALAGRAVGSRFRLEGDVWGLPIGVDEVVIERRAPSHKIWETVGTPRLVVVGHYRMEFHIAPTAAGSLLTVGIDYRIPPWRPAMLARVVARWYARWCVRRMAADASDRYEGNRNNHEDKHR